MRQYGIVTGSERLGLLSDYTAIADSSSRQRGRPTETRPQISDSNIPTGSNIWSQAPQGCSIPRHSDWLTVSRKVTSTFDLRVTLVNCPTLEPDHLLFDDWRAFCHDVQGRSFFVSFIVIYWPLSLFNCIASDAEVLQSSEVQNIQVKYM
jgi:hypothetical protein